jgi:hypothetical protein
MGYASSALTVTLLLVKIVSTPSKTAAHIALMDYNVYNAILDTRFTMAIAILLSQTALSSTQLPSFAADVPQTIIWFYKTDFTHAYCFLTTV